MSLWHWQSLYTPTPDTMVGAGVMNTRMKSLENRLGGTPYYPVLDDEEGVTNGRYPWGDVRRYGAIGDGVRDDTTAIQNALDSIAGAFGGGEVYVAPGTYKFTKLTVAANVTIVGAGRGTTILHRYANSGDAGDAGLFGVRLAGDHAGLRHCSVKGRWDPADPTTQVYDIPVSVYGNDVEHTLVEDVEIYNCHIGYLVGGIVASATATFSGQNYNRAVGCYAHDTYDLGFGLIAKGTADADTCIGCAIIDCWQEDSYATAGLEIRFQRAAHVVRFNARNNTNTSLGAGIRLEETSYAIVDGLHTVNCYMGLQVINDSYYCTASNITTRTGARAIYIRHSADIELSNLLVVGPTSRGVMLAYADGTSWTRNNERILVDGGLIAAAGTYGIEVVGTGFTEAALEDNGTGLRVHGVTIRQSGTHGILLQAGGSFQIVGNTFDDNGVDVADGTGILLQNPNPGGVADTAKPANGYIGENRFISTGDQVYAVQDTLGLTAYGTFHNIGGGTLPVVAHRTTDTETAVVTERGSYRETRVIAAADSPYTVKATDYVIRGNATAGAITVNLPAAASSQGRVLIIKKTDASVNAVTLDGNSSETIDGAATLAIGTQYQARAVQCDGSNWNIVGAHL